MANVGNMDRMLRFAVGIILIALPFLPFTAGYFAGWGNWAYAVAAVGAVMVLTAVFRFCPAYTLLGVNTCERA